MLASRSSLTLAADPQATSGSSCLLYPVPGYAFWAAGVHGPARDNFLQLEGLTLEILDFAGGRRLRREGIGVGLRCADTQHVQDHLHVVRIILVPTVVQRFSGPSQGNRGDEAQRGNPASGQRRPSGGVKEPPGQRVALLSSDDRTAPKHGSRVAASGKIVE